MTGSGISSLQSAMNTDVPHGAYRATSAEVPAIGQMERSVYITSDTTLCAFAREMAISRAWELAEYFEAERTAHEALYARTSCFSHKGAADRAHINETKGAGDSCRADRRKEGSEMTQYDRIGKVLQRKRGATTRELIEASGSVCPWKRMQEMRNRGWLIWREKVPGKSYGVYRGCYAPVV